MQYLAKNKTFHLPTFIGAPDAANLFAVGYFLISILTKGLKLLIAPNIILHKNKPFKITFIMKNIL